jgi:hypothetical protein
MKRMRRKLRAAEESVSLNKECLCLEIVLYSHYGCLYNETISLIHLGFFPNYFISYIIPTLQ